MSIQNVRNFGAVGDGTTDDSDEIIAAVNACFPSGGAIKGGEVYLPAGSYLVSKTVLSSLITVGGITTFRGSAITIKGDGPQATKLILNAPNTVPIFDIKGANDGGGNFQLASWFTLQDLTLDGQNNTIPQWINFDHAVLARIERVQIINTKGNAIKGLQLWDSVFRNVLIDNVGDFRTVSGVGTLYPAVQLLSPVGDSSNNVKFEGVQFNNNQYISVDMGQDVHVIFFYGCSFKGNANTGYTNVRFTGTSLPSNSIAGSGSFIGCQFLNSGTSYHINATYAKGLVISNSSFEASYLNAIYFSNCDRCLVSDSNFYNSAGNVTNGSGTTGTDLNVKQVSSTNITVQQNLGGLGA